MENLTTYLASVDALTDETRTDAKKAPYIHPKLKNLGCVNIVVLREAIAPTVFRNAEQEITDIEWLDDVYPGLVCTAMTNCDCVKQRWNQYA